jgi:hypothetical protein
MTCEAALKTYFVSVCQVINLFSKMLKYSYIAY